MEREGCKLTERTDEHVLKLAMVYSAIEKQSVITAGSIEHSDLNRQVVEKTMLEAFGEVGTDNFSRAEKTVLDIVRTKGRFTVDTFNNGCTRRDQRRNSDSSYHILGEKRSPIEGVETTGAGQKKPYVEMVPL